MTTNYTGSNYGIISTLNTGSGTLIKNGIQTFTFELVKNYTSGSILLGLEGITDSSTCTLVIEYSNNNTGTIIDTEIYKYLNYNVLPQIITHTIQFKPKGNYMRIKLYNDNVNNSVNYNIQTKFNNSADPTPTVGIISPLNSFNYGISSNVSMVPLSSMGIFEDISQYSLITIMMNGTSDIVPSPYTIKGIFSQDGINNDRIVEYTQLDVTANGIQSASTSLTFNPPHTLLPIAKYFKVYISSNISTPPSTIRFTTTYHTDKSKGLTSRVTQNLSDQVDTDTNRAILVGRTLGTMLPQGHYENIGIQNQSLATYIREPATAFGELLSANLSPVIQYEFSNGSPYELQAPIFQNLVNSTSYTYESSFLNIQTNGANSVIQAYSNEYTKYKAGQGIDIRMTGIFQSSNIIGSNQYLGLWTPENSLSFGYFSTLNGQFGLGYSRDGTSQIVNFTVSTQSTTTGQIYIGFGTDSIVTSSITGASTTTACAAAQAITNVINSYSNFNKYGWRAQYYQTVPNISTNFTIQCARRYADNNLTPITISSLGTLSGYTYTSSIIRNGSPEITTYIPQNQWNIDTCMDMGSLQANYLYNPSGFQLNPTLGNVYRIQFQYLGFGAITYLIENPQTGTFIPVHQIKYANTSKTTSVSSPNYRVGYFIESNNNTNSITLKGASVATFIQGINQPSPVYRSIPVTLASNTLSPISKINSRVIFGFRLLNTKSSTNSNGLSSYTINRNNLFLNSLSAALNVTFGGAGSSNTANIVFQIVKNPTNFYLGDPTLGVPFCPQWRLYESDSTLLVFDGLTTTSNNTGIGYTGGINVFDMPLVQNTAQSYDLNSMKINVSVDDLFIITYYGTAVSVTTYDVLANISYQINI